MLRFAFIMVLLLLLNAARAMSANDTVGCSGVDFSIALPDTIYTGMIYDSLFEFINLDHVTGEKDEVNLTLKYYLHNSTGVTGVDFVSIVSLNYKRKAKTGELVLDSPGEYGLCASIVNSTSVLNITREICKNITVLDTSSQECNASLKGIILERRPYSAGESIKYSFDIDPAGYPFVIEYGVTDLFGEGVRSLRNTSNTDKKSFTLKSLDEKDRVYVIDATLHPLCNDSFDDDNSAREFVVVTDDKEEDKDSWMVIDPSVKGDMVMVDLEVYKGDTRKYAISLSIIDSSGRKVSDVVKVYVAVPRASYIRITLLR